MRRHDPDVASAKTITDAAAGASSDRAPEYVPLAGPIVLQTVEQVRFDLRRSCQA